MNMENFSIVFIFCAIIALIIAGPLLVILSLNTLFPVMAIPYNFYTWAAMAWLGAVIKGSSKVN